LGSEGATGGRVVTTGSEDARSEPQEESMARHHGEQEHFAGDDTDDSPTGKTHHGETLTLRPGDTAFGTPGDDTIAISPVVGGGPVTGHDRATVFAGPGDDTIIDGSVEESTFPVTVDGGPGNDTIIGPSVDDARTTFLTGGPGHDLFVFSAQLFHAVGNVTITDFGRQDAIRIDIDPANPPTIGIVDHGGSAEIHAVTVASGVDLNLTGHFDPNRFHITNDGQGHEFITYGHHAGDWFLS
jgi:hypothetical protein